jgi:hypothetical protein
MGNPWDRPPIPEKKRVGRNPCFKRWERRLRAGSVEQSIASLFTFVTTGKYHDVSAPALRAYGLATWESGQR